MPTGARRRGIGARHQTGDGLHEGEEVGAGRGDALAVRFLQFAVIAVGHQFHLGAADVDAVIGAWIRIRHGGRW
jgi:hypothetical protein